MEMSTHLLTSWPEGEWEAALGLAGNGLELAPWREEQDYWVPLTFTKRERKRGGGGGVCGGCGERYEQFASLRRR